MEKSTVTTKGQVVIPSRIRRKLKIKQGTQVTFLERDGEIIIRPVTDEYIEKMAGFTKTKGRLLKALETEKAREREL
jgi:AbrB family looped-hinge helix DNA binding protein